MKLTVFGTGCAKCHSLAERTGRAAQELGLSCEMTKVTDLRQIMALGIMMTPALAVNGTVKVTGKVPTVEELKALLLEENAAANG